MSAAALSPPAGDVGVNGTPAGDAAGKRFVSLPSARAVTPRLQSRLCHARCWHGLRIAIVSRIERTYHRRRRQPVLGRLIPIEYEAIMTTQPPRLRNNRCHQLVQQTRLGRSGPGTVAESGVAGMCDADAVGMTHAPGGILTWQYPVPPGVCSRWRWRSWR